jgi:UDP-N-acetyl-2-amino-2-deoxyglucuronate dehydrogenase
MFTTDPHVFWSKHLDAANVDTVVICTPNDLHYAHTMEAIASGRRVIVEKPMLLPGQILEEKYSELVTPVAQLRYLSAFQMLRDRVAMPARRHTVDIIYSTYRGPWYNESWKHDVERSGGVLLNLGIHLVDLCHWLFGDLEKIITASKSAREVHAVVRFERADVMWHLSSNRPGKRLMTVDGVPYDLSQAWEELHLRVYHDHERGRCICTPDEAQKAICTVDLVTKRAASS